MAVEELRERDARLNTWLADVSPGDTVTVRLNSTDTLTGKVYEVPDAGGTSLCVWTTVLRHGNGHPGGSYEPVRALPDPAVDAINGADTLEEALYLTVGAASTCWSDLGGAGVYDSERAARLGSALLELVRGYVR